MGEEGPVSGCIQTSLMCDVIAVCAGGDVLKGYITDRRQRLRKIDEEALTRYRAFASDGKGHSGAVPGPDSYGLGEAMRLTPKTPAGMDKGTPLTSICWHCMPPCMHAAVLTKNLSECLH